MTKDKILDIREYYSIPSCISDEQIERDLESSLRSATYEIETSIKELKNNFIDALKSCF